MPIDTQPSLRRGLLRLMAALLLMMGEGVLLAQEVAGPASAPTLFSADRQWALASSRDGAKVYTSDIEGSPYRAVKATITIKADAESVIRSFDSSQAKKNGCSPWRQMCKASRVLSNPSEEVSHVYLVLDLPWPVSDRDLAARSQLHIDRQQARVTLDIVSDASLYPPQDYVRADVTIRYVMQQLEDSLTEVVYINHTNLNGNVPPGLFNSKVVSSTTAEILALKRFVEP